MCVCVVLLYGRSYFSYTDMLLTESVFNSLFNHQLTIKPYNLGPVC